MTPMHPLIETLNNHAKTTAKCVDVSLALDVEGSRGADWHQNRRPQISSRRFPPFVTAC